MKAAVKYRITGQCTDKYPIAGMSLFFEVSRSGYYAWFARQEPPDSDQPLAALIAECQSKRGKIHGYRYIQLWLEKAKHIHRNPKAVLRIMRKYDLLSEIRRKCWKSCGQAIHRYDNILTCPIGISSLFDNSIVAYLTAARQTVTLVMSTSISTILSVFK